VSSGGLAVKQAPGIWCQGSQVRSQQEVETFSEINFLGSLHRGWLTTLNGAAVSTEILKIKGDVKDPPRT